MSIASKNLFKICRKFKTTFKQYVRISVKKLELYKKI